MKNHEITLHVSFFEFCCFLIFTMTNRPKTREIPLATAQDSFGNEGRFVLKVMSYQVANQCGKDIGV